MHRVKPAMVNCGRSIQNQSNGSLLIVILFSFSRDQTAAATGRLTSANPVGLFDHPCSRSLILESFILHYYKGYAQVFDWCGRLYFGTEPTGYPKTSY